MPNYIILDTSIYRELGLRFFDNIDYRNLCNFTLNTDGEVLISNIVMEEFVNYYKVQLKTKTTALMKSWNDLQRDPFYFAPHFKADDIVKDYDSAVDQFKDKIQKDPISNNRLILVQPTYISGLALTRFILDSRELKESNVQIRDYLIWDSILSYAKFEDGTQHALKGKKKVIPAKNIVTFITKDKGFADNQLFNDLKQKYVVDNVELENSITGFLKKKGFYFDFITEDLILDKIQPVRILKDLNKDVGALLSYVSERYQQSCYEKKVIESVIENIEILKKFTYLDSTVKKYKFIAELKVDVKVVFERDEIGWAESSQKSIEDKNVSRQLETYDENQRPYFNRPILFFYGGLVNIHLKSIKSVRFIDFMPNIYI